MSHERDLVFLSRDPRDVIVSSYFEQTRREAPGSSRRFDGDIATFIRDEDFGIVTVVGFMNRWLASRFKVRRFLLIRYEDMIEDMTSELAKLLCFLGVDEVSATVLEDAVDFGRFENMKRLEDSQALASSRLRAADPDDPESRKVRKGRVGGFVDYLTGEDRAFVDAVIARDLDSTLGYGIPPA